MSLLNQLRSRIGLDGSTDRQVTERATRAARRTGERVRNVDTERAGRATRQASESLAVDPPGRVRRGRGTSREQDVAERAERAASMQGPVDASLEPADSMGIDQLARGGSRIGDTADATTGPRTDDLATNVGSQPEDDGGIFEFSSSETADDDGWGWP